MGGGYGALEIQLEVKVPERLRLSIKNFGKEDKVGNICECEGNKSIVGECLYMKDEPIDKCDYRTMNYDRLKYIVSSNMKASLKRIMNPRAAKMYVGHVF